jgi:hypothetical protein
MALRKCPLPAVSAGAPNPAAAAAAWNKVRRVIAVIIQHPDCPLEARRSTLLFSLYFY